jgi:uncharacterized RDD family membrane protein YckC
MNTGQGRRNLYAPPESEVSGNGRTGASIVIGVALVFITLLAWTGTTILFIHRNGQSIAKRIIGIKVVRSDGSRATLRRILWLRNFLNGLLGAIPVIGFICKLVDYRLIFGEKQQCIHGMIADAIFFKA